MTVGTTPAARGSFGNTARFATLSGGLARTGFGGGDGRPGKFWSQHSVLVLIDQAMRHVIGATAVYRHVSKLLIRPKGANLILTYLVLFAGAAVAGAGAAALGVRCLRLGPAELLFTPVQREEAPMTYRFLESAFRL